MPALPYALEQLDIRTRRIATNGIELNVFEAGSGPLIVLIHGFPECWASWGPQIHFLVEQGYRVMVPEMRGYGESGAPENIEAYDAVELAADVAGLIDAGDQDKALVIGHDWGCTVAWHVAWLHPEKLVAVGGLSVPWFGRGEVPILDVIKAMFPDNYFYITDFQRQECTDLLDQDISHSFNVMMLGEMEMLNQPNDGRSFLERAVPTEQRPEYMPSEFIDYLISRYHKHGFGPPQNWYRNFQRTFDRTAQNLDDVIKMPAMYLTGNREWTADFAEALGMDYGAYFTDMRVRGVIDAGHWLGQEQPEWVNEKIAEFLQSVDY